MRYVPVLPPGRWRSPEDEAHWDMLLEWHETVGVLYRQQLYRTHVDPEFAARMENVAFRTRFEKKHKEKCDQVEAAVKSHIERNYIPDAGTLEADFELQWVFTEDA
jgi:hypothetical protein